GRRPGTRGWSCSPAPAQQGEARLSGPAREPAALGQAPWTGSGSASSARGGRTHGPVSGRRGAAASRSGADAPGPRRSQAAPSMGAAQVAGRGAQCPALGGLVDPSPAGGRLVLATDATGAPATPPARAAGGICLAVSLLAPGLGTARAGSTA